MAASLLFSGLFSTRSSGAGAPAGAAVAKPGSSSTKTQTNFDRLSSDILSNAISFLGPKDRSAAFAACKSLSTQKAVLSPALAKMDERDRSLRSKFTSLCDFEREQAKYKSSTMFGRLRSLFMGLNEAQYHQMKAAFERMKVLIIEDLLYEGYSVEKILQKIQENVERFVPKEMQPQVLAELREAAFQIILKRYASELAHNLGTQTINTDAVAVCTALATIPRAEKEANLKALKAIIADQHPGAIDKARERLIRVCTLPGAFLSFVNEKRKTALAQIVRLKLQFQESPTDLIKKLNLKLRCDIGAGFYSVEGQVVTEIDGLHLPDDGSLTLLQVVEIVDAKISELAAAIGFYEQNRSSEALKVFKLFHGYPGDFTADNLGPDFIRYAESSKQLFYLTRAYGFAGIRREVQEKRDEIALLEAAILDAPRCCVADIEARRQSLDLLTPEGDVFSWPEQVTHFIPPAIDEPKDKAECVEEVD